MAASELEEHERDDAPDAALHPGPAHIAKLPSGAVTFLYTDVEGATERWEQAPDAMCAALGRHHAMHEGQTAQAAVLFGVWEQKAASHRAGQHVWTDDEQAPLVAARERVRAQLGEETFAHHYAAGQQLSLPEAIALAQEIAGLPSGDGATALP
jgi:hypothetical protein